MRADPTKLAASTCLTALAFVALGASPASAQERPISLRDSFPVGSNGLCEAQIMEPIAGAGLFDRGYRVVCRDAAAPVGTLWVVRQNAELDPVSRFLPEPMNCQAAGDALAPETLADRKTLACDNSENGIARSLAFGSHGGRLYAAQSVSAYDDVVRLGLETLASDQVAEGDVEIPLTQSTDALAFVRAQARSIAADAALGEAYRRSNSGSFAEAAEFFAQSAEVLSGSSANEALLNQALQQSNLGNYREAARLFAQVRAPAAADPVLGRMLRNYQAIDALNAGQPAAALALLDAPLVSGMGAGETLRSLEISEAVATRLAAEQIDVLSGAGGLTALERADLLDGQADYLRGVALRLEGNPALAATALSRADATLSRVRGGRITSILWLRAQIYAELADLRETSGDLAGAEALHRQAIMLLEQNYPGSPALVSARAQLGALFARNGRDAEALTVYRELVDQAGNKPAPALRRLLAPYFDLLAKGQSGEQDAADLLLASQLLQRPGLAQTQAVLARELSGGSDEASQLFRKSVNLGRSIEQVRNAVALLEAQAADSPLLASQLAERQAELESLTTLQLATQDKLGEFPRYRVVSDGRLTLAQLREALRPGEGYLKLITLDRNAYAVFVTPESARAYAIEMAPSQLEEEVAALRNTIAVVEDGQTLTFPFDIERARKLYVALMGPVDAEVQAVDHLIFEPDGAMLQLPANLLVMDDASVARYAARVASDEDNAFDFTGTSWLGKAMEVSTTVSPAAFRDTRAARASNAANEYIGFGENEPLSESVGERTGGTRSALAGGANCLWSANIWNNPIEAEELRVAANSLPGTDRIVTGEAFTDKAILGMEDLGEFRILHFATHGLVTAPQPDCPPRPALLTSLGAEGSDGLLSFAEIFDLKLDADLVILSACDTAGQATVGATREAGVTSGGGYALDGLVRAFVGAGGRTVVASHWPVPDDYDATNRLISGFFDAPQGSSIASALHDAQVALMNGKETSHPFYWAAFAVIGDGATTLRR